MFKKMIILVWVLFMVVITQAIPRHTREEEFVRAILEVGEGETFEAVIRICDVDNDVLGIEIDDLPDGATLSIACVTDPNYGLEIPCDPNYSSFYAAILRWTPTYQQAGEYRLHIHGFDDDGGHDWVVYVINVGDRNQPPFCVCLRKLIRGWCKPYNWQDFVRWFYLRREDWNLIEN